MSYLTKAAASEYEFYPQRLQESDLVALEKSPKFPRSLGNVRTHKSPPAAGASDARQPSRRRHLVRISSKGR